MRVLQSSRVEAKTQILMNTAAIEKTTLRNELNGLAGPYTKIEYANAFRAKTPRLLTMSVDLCFMHATNLPGIRKAEGQWAEQWDQEPLLVRRE